MARSVWTGSISFGLVNVPVKAYTAVRDHTVHFNQLEKDTGARIRNEKVSDKTGDPVEGDDIELGYEIRSGRYVTFEKGELDDLKPESTRAVEVTDFVALEDVDPIYYERTYWLGPDGDAGAKAYQLLLAAMEDRGRVAVGTVVMRNKQYLTAIRPLDGALAMSTMRFADEVVAKSDLDEVPSRRSKPEPKALKLATQIIDSLEADWDPAQYHDTFTEELRRIIDRKDKGKEAVVEEAAPAQSANVIDLMSALQASVKAAKKTRGKRADALAKAAEDLLEEAGEVDDDAGNGSSASGSRDSGKARGTAKKAAPKKKASSSSTPSKASTAKKKAGAKKAGAKRSSAKKPPAKKAARARSTASPARKSA